MEWKAWYLGRRQSLGNDSRYFIWGVGLALCTWGRAKSRRRELQCTILCCAQLRLGHGKGLRVEGCGDTGMCRKQGGSKLAGLHEGLSVWLQLWAINQEQCLCPGPSGGRGEAGRGRWKNPPPRPETKALGRTKLVWLRPYQIGRSQASHPREDPLFKAREQPCKIGESHSEGVGYRLRESAGEIAPRFAAEDKCKFLQIRLLLKSWAGTN